LSAPVPTFEMGFANVEFRADSEDNTVTVTLNHPAAGHGGYTLSDRLDLDQTGRLRDWLTLQLGEQ